MQFTFSFLVCWGSSQAISTKAIYRNRNTAFFDDFKFQHAFYDALQFSDNFDVDLFAILILAMQY